MQPDLVVSTLSVAGLVPYAENARTHSPAQVAQIAASIAEFGFVNPVLVDAEGVLIAGHGRVMAAKQLGLATVPVLRLGHLSPAQARALRLADNQIALNSGWDEALLIQELTALRELDVNLALTGFSDGDVAALFAKGAERHTDPDDAPEPPTVAVSVLGDCWVLGDHRIRCGDSTSAADVDALLGGERPHLMVTDPPYGVEYDPDWRRRAGVGSAGAASGVVLNDDRADWREAWALFPGAVAYVWHGGLHSHTVAESLRAARFGLRAQIVWVKTRPALSRGHYHWQHEPAWHAVREGAEEDHWRFVPEHEVSTYAVREGQIGSWHGGRKQSTVWFIEHLKSDTGHGTQKPVECMRRPIENNSAPGDAVYEPFSGSGTTLIAAQMTGRRCFAMELNPPYVDMAVVRWQNFTGRSATLEGDGRTFAEIEEARRQASAA